CREEGCRCARIDGQDPYIGESQPRGAPGAPTVSPVDTLENAARGTGRGAHSSHIHGGRSLRIDDHSGEYQILNGRSPQDGVPLATSVGGFEQTGSVCSVEYGRRLRIDGPGRNQGDRFPPSPEHRSGQAGVDRVPVLATVVALEHAAAGEGPQTSGHPGQPLHWSATHIDSRWRFGVNDQTADKPYGQPDVESAPTRA